MESIQNIILKGKRLYGLTFHSLSCLTYGFSRMHFHFIFINVCSFDECCNKMKACGAYSLLQYHSAPAASNHLRYLPDTCCFTYSFIYSFLYLSNLNCQQETTLFFLCLFSTSIQCIFCERMGIGLWTKGQNALYISIYVFSLLTMQIE